MGARHSVFITAARIDRTQNHPPGLYNFHKDRIELIPRSARKSIISTHRCYQSSSSSSSSSCSSLHRNTRASHAHQLYAIFVLLLCCGWLIQRFAMDAPNVSFTIFVNAHNFCADDAHAQFRRKTGVAGICGVCYLYLCAQNSRIPNIH